MLQDGFFDRRKPLHIRRGNLPHWRQEGALYFVTFRLGDSLPQSKLEQWRREQYWWRTVDPPISPEELSRRTLEQRRRIERWLDRGLGSCVLRIPGAKRIVEDAIRYFDGERYELGEFTVAPNHVHALVRPAIGIDLSQVLHTWKRYTSREVGRLDEVRDVLPSNQGSLWQTESFDHIVRNQSSLERFSNYIRNHRR
jgi:REP element-mobilizing transposase RayT